MFFRHLVNSVVSPNTSISFHCIRFRAGFFNVYLGLSDQDHRDAVENHIDRYRPDILGLSEINASDQSYLQNTLGPNNGYSYFQMGEVLSLQPALMSKYEIVESGILSSTSPANEFRRKPVWAVIDVGHDTKNVLVYVCHTESWCYSGPCLNVARPELEFPRAIEWIRLKEHMEAKLAVDPLLEVIVMGDMNDDDLSPQTNLFNGQPNGVWGGFQLGTDITFPVQHATYPIYQATQMNLTTLLSTDLDGDRNTIWTTDPNPAFTVPVKLDYICHSDGLAASEHEIANSEATQTGGMLKYGNELPAGESQDASDHKMVNADFKLPV